MLQNNKTFVLWIILLVLIAGGGFFIGFKLYQKKTTQNSTPSVTVSTPPQQGGDLSQLFDLSKKEPGTKLYFSERLGVGFTYLSHPSDTVTVQESENKISIGTKFDTQTIEVLKTDGNDTLRAAIERNFLQGYNPQDCFVAMYKQWRGDHERAGISFPPTDDPNLEPWAGSQKCPPSYSETNGAQYFMKSNSVPGKYIFVRIGQDSVATDGTPRDAQGNGFNWDHSIQILR